MEISRQSWPPQPSGWYIIELSTYRGKEVLVGWIDHGNRSELALLIPVTVHSLFITKPVLRNLWNLFVLVQDSRHFTFILLPLRLLNYFSCIYKIKRSNLLYRLK